MRGILQEYHLSPLEEREIQQLQEPFIVTFNNENQVVSLLTAANESLASLSIKYQVVHTVLPDKNLYTNLAKNIDESKVEWDLTKLPFGFCNATVDVAKNNESTTVSIESQPTACQVFNLGGGQLTDESRFKLDTTFDNDDFTLKQRREKVDVVMTKDDTDRKAILDYEYLLVLSNFEENGGEYFDMKKITVRYWNLEISLD